MSKQLNPQSIQKLIKAIAEYRDNLSTNIGELSNASNICSQAMGSDQISRNYITRLNEAIDQLKKTVALCNEAISELQGDYRRAIDVQDNL